MISLLEELLKEIKKDDKIEFEGDILEPKNPEHEKIKDEIIREITRKKQADEIERKKIEDLIDKYRDPHKRIPWERDWDWTKFNDWRNDSDNQVCLIEEAMRRELSKPPWLRTNAFFISCPCHKCNPFYM